MNFQSSEYLYSKSEYQYCYHPEVYSPKKCISLPEPFFLKQAVSETTYDIIHRIKLEQLQRKRAEHSFCIPHDWCKPHTYLDYKYIYKLSQILEEHNYRRCEICKSKYEYHITENVVEYLNCIYAWNITHAYTKNYCKNSKEAVYKKR